MVFFNPFSSLAVLATEEIAQVVDTVPADCAMDCGLCETSFPKSLKIDDAPLWKSTKPYLLHCVVPTGETDWPHDATGTSGTLAHAVDKWAGSGVKVTVLLLPHEYDSVAQGDVLLLPWFVWVRDVDTENVGTVLTEVTSGLEAGKQPLEIAVSAGRVEVSPYTLYIFLCLHKTRDKRCGVTAPIMKKEFDAHLRDSGHLRDYGDTRPGGIDVSFINHVGGHKFTANVMVYKKSGEMVWYARCVPQHVEQMLKYTVLPPKGQVWPDHVRLVQRSRAVDW